MAKDVIIFEQVAIISDPRRRTGACENPHTPPSHGSIPKRKKAGRRKDTSDHKKPGRKKCHEGVLHHNKAARAVCRAPRKCHKCGSGRIKGTGRSTTGVLSDMERVPRAEAVENVTYECLYEDCCATTGVMEDPAGMPGTDVGPNVTRFAVKPHYSESTIQHICDVISTLVPRACKATMQRA